MLYRRFVAFSLIEVVISGALVATAVGALFAATSLATRLTTLGQDRLIAIQLARQGIETVRQIRDANQGTLGCTESEACSHWERNIIQVVPQRESLPAHKAIRENAVSENRLDTVPFNLTSVGLDRDSPCTDYLIRDVRTGTIQSVSRLEARDLTAHQLFCRRLTIESPPDSLITTDGQVGGQPLVKELAADPSGALLIRSQVAWLGNGKNEWRDDFSGDHTPCDTSLGASEWCTEEVMLLTNWGSAL